MEASPLQPAVSSNDRTQGSLSAPVVLVEYGDFECPDCGQAYLVVKKLKEDLGDKLTVVFRHMPLNKIYPIHPNATLAAHAAEAAQAQGKFWEMHDALFENQDNLSEENILRLAREVGLDADQFEYDFESAEVMEKVDTDFASGQANGVTATPAFFINGEKVEESRDYAALSAKIRELAA